MAEKHLEATQIYEAMAQVVSHSFGSEASEENSQQLKGKFRARRSESLATAKVKPENQANTSDEAIAMFKSIFGK